MIEGGRSSVCSVLEKGREWGRRHGGISAYWMDGVGMVDLSLQAGELVVFGLGAYRTLVDLELMSARVL